MAESESERRKRFDALFDAYRLDVAAYCSWRAGSESDAQDAAAEVFLIAWRRLDELPEGDAARVWLYATARRVIANQRRSRRRRTALHERLAAHVASRPLEAPPSDEVTVVRDALRRLGARDREALLLAEWEGLSPAEIATVLDCPTATVRTRLHRARSRFRDAYDEELRAQDGAETSRRSLPASYSVSPAAVNGTPPRSSGGFR